MFYVTDRIANRTSMKTEVWCTFDTLEGALEQIKNCPGGLSVLRLIPQYERAWPIADATVAKIKTSLQPGGRISTNYIRELLEADILEDKTPADDVCTLQDAARNG